MRSKKDKTECKICGNIHNVNQECDCHREEKNFFNFMMSVLMYLLGILIVGLVLLHIIAKITRCF